MSDFDDFELDEETLRQIEEEARREVEADFELDPETLKMIEQAAREEASLEDMELDDDFLADIQEEVMIDDFDLDLDDMDMSDLDVPEPAAAAAPSPPAPAPVTPPPAVPVAPPPATPVAPAATTSAPAAAPVAAPVAAAVSPPAQKVPEEVKVRVVDDGNLDGAEGAVQRAKREAYERAKQEALDRKKKAAVAKARNAVRIRGRGRGVAGSHASEVRQMENQMVKKQSTLAMIGIIGGVILLFALLAGGAIIAMNRPKTKTEPVKIDYVKGGQIVTQPNNPTPNDSVEATKMFNTVVRNERRIRRPKDNYASIANIKKELDRIKELRTKYPDFAANRSQKLTELEDKLQKHLKVYESFGGGGESGGGDNTGGGGIEIK